MFVTTRIATVDMLAERLPPSRVAGLVIASAHRVEFSGEAFAVRLFRGEPARLRQGGSPTARGTSCAGSTPLSAR